MENNIELNISDFSKNLEQSLLNFNNDNNDNNNDNDNKDNDNDNNNDNDNIIKNHETYVYLINTTENHCP